MPAKLATASDAQADAGVVAFDKRTGNEVWHSVSMKDAGYAPPMIYEFGGKRQLILWHPQAVNSLDPVTGKETSHSHLEDW